jgi:hypothetical protein
MNGKSVLLGAAVAGLCLVGAGCASNSSSEVIGKCHGVNACKGTGDCGGKTHACAGHNKCKGAGWKKMTQDNCKDKGGEFVSKGSNS